MVAVCSYGVGGRELKCLCEQTMNGLESPGGSRGSQMNTQMFPCVLPWERF